MIASATDMRVYHGTRTASTILAEGFRPSTGGEFGPGVYLTERIESAHFWAAHNARGPEAPTIIEVEVDLKNPKRVDKVEWIRLTQSSTPSAVQRRWIKKGHDGILGVGINGLDVQVVAFDPASVRPVRVVERLRPNAGSGREEWVPEPATDAASSAERLRRAMDALTGTRTNPRTASYREELIHASSEEVGWLSIHGIDAATGHPIDAMEFTADFGSARTVAKRLRELGYNDAAAWVARRRGEWAYLNVISVPSGSHGSGAGTALMRHGLQRLHALGSRRLIGIPSPDPGRMADLLRFYEKFGIATVSIGGVTWIEGPIKSASVAA